MIRGEPNDPPENTALSQDVYRRHKEAGLIYVKPVEQFYDPVKKMFLADRYIKGECPNCHSKDQYGDVCEVCSTVYTPTELINPYSTLSGATPELRTSDHYFFKLSAFTEKLIQLYKHAGAKYFVALANHHDNFDTFDSTYQPWNSVNIGPHKDIVGTWAKAARAAGLRFGVSSHASHAWAWYEVAQGSDKTGPLAGVSYDGKLTKADGAGKWWDGLDRDYPLQSCRGSGRELPEWRAST